MKFKPMLAKLGDESIVDKKEYIFEPKLDGYRVLLEKNNSKINLFSRRGKNMNSDFKNLTEIHDLIKAKKAVLDGEVVVYNKKGLPDFQLLQNRKNNDVNFSFVVFDILTKDEKDLTSKSLEERKKILKQTVKESENVQIIASTKNGKRLWSEIKKVNLEGMIAKKINSKYQQKRSSDWIKIKRTKTIDCIILGYKTNKREISSVLLGVYENNKIVYLGKAGTGFNEKNMKKLKEKFKPIKQNKKPKNYPKDIKEKSITWLKPKITSEIKYSELTRDKKLRAPVFLHLREDKKPEDCNLSSQIKT